MSTSQLGIPIPSRRLFDLPAEPSAGAGCEAALIDVIDRAARGGTGAALIVYRIDMKSSAAGFGGAPRGRALVAALRGLIDDMFGQGAVSGETACGALAIASPGVSLAAAIRKADAVAAVIVQRGILAPFQDAVDGVDWFIAESGPEDDARAFVQETLLDAIGMS